jgi:hypothetical protein
MTGAEILQTICISAGSILGVLAFGYLGAYGLAHLQLWAESKDEERE